MHKFLLFIGGLAALLILLANLGPMVLLAVSLWLLYVIFKKFVKSNSVIGKAAWAVAGLIILSIGLANIYAVIGIAAAYVLYVIVKSWKKDKTQYAEQVVVDVDDDPFTNFDKQWAELNR